MAIFGHFKSRMT